MAKDHLENWKQGWRTINIIGSIAAAIVSSISIGQDDDAYFDTDLIIGAPAAFSNNDDVAKSRLTPSLNDPLSAVQHRTNI
jgi:hypothetical protein